MGSRKFSTLTTRVLFLITFFILAQDVAPREITGVLGRGKKFQCIYIYIYHSFFRNQREVWKKNRMIRINSLNCIFGDLIAEEKSVKLDSHDAVNSLIAAPEGVKYRMSGHCSIPREAYDCYEFPGRCSPPSDAAATHAEQAKSCP